MVMKHMDLYFEQLEWSAVEIKKFIPTCNMLNKVIQYKRKVDFNTALYTAIFTAGSSQNKLNVIPSAVCVTFRF